MELPLILDGKKLAQSIQTELAQAIENAVLSKKRPPGLATVLVGDDPASHTYIRLKHKAALELGIHSKHMALPSQTDLKTLLSHINQLNQDPTIDGILVQFPLPNPQFQTPVIEQIAPHKDVDGFHPHNVGLLWSGTPKMVPCTPLGCMRLIYTCLPSLKGLKAVVVGRSNVVGKPMAALLLQAHATVTLAHRYTHNLEACTKEADVLVVAAGVPGLITKNHVKPGAIVIDVGMNRTDGKLVGDVLYDEVAPLTKAITPVPGGVGPMTIAMLAQNTYQAYLGNKT